MKIITIIIVFAILFYLFPIFIVEGRSMFPTIKPNRILIATRLFNKNDLKINDIYIFKTPYEPKKKVVKRLKEVKKGKNTLCYFLGDNSEESYDSRYYGYVDAENIIAKVLWY